MAIDNLPQILICDDDQPFHLAVKHGLKGHYQCRSAMNTDEAVTIVQKYPIDLILLDIEMRTKNEGLESIPRFKEIDPDLAIVMSSGRKDFHSVRDAMRLGAHDYVPKDFEADDLLHTISRVLDHRSLLKRKHQQNYEAVTAQKQHVLVGKNQQIKALQRTIERVKLSPANVLILGETGTGKEVVARQLRHQLTDGSLAPFLAVDSSTIQSSTAESLLFGHEKGAFTGAEKTTRGLFEEANSGIVYFDEIANMPIDIQAKLLRVLQEKEVVRLGSSKVIPLQFRVVCASNKDLDELVRAGRFKEDLLQRINVIPIHLPPLRDRTEDIGVLIEHFLKRSGPAGEELTFTEAAIDMLKQYQWPGNVRELQNIVAYLLAMTEGTEIDVADLPPKLRDAAQKHVAGNNPNTGATEKADTGKTYYEQVAIFEQKILGEEYKRADGNISRMALHLGMDRSHLYTKLREFNLHRAVSKT